MKDQIEKLIARLKGLDKKVWIIAGAVAVAVIALVVTLVLVLGGSGDTPDNKDAQTTTTTVQSTTTTTKATTTTTKKTTTTTKATTTTTKATTTTTTTTVVTQAPTDAPTQVPTDAPTTIVTQPTATNPEGEEIFGAGSKDEPYLETPSDDMTVKTVDIPAGKSLYYSIYRVGGMLLTIDSANAYVVCDGVRHDASGGKVSFEVPAALASDAVSFEIGNTGSSAASFTLRFSNQQGSYMSPVTVSKLGGDNKVSLPEGANTGYYYKYVAEKSGTIRFYLTASTDSVLLATNNRNSAQRTTEDDGATDANGKTYIDLEVQAGDEIIINVGAKPNKRGKYPAADITWSGKYV